jgi:hypothetical protein
MTEQLCFFKTPYKGERCKCGWDKSMKKDVPKAYIDENGNIKRYVLNSLTASNKTVYGCCRNKQKRSATPPKHQNLKYIINHNDNTVRTKGQWPKKMENYLENALVEKHGRNNLNCIGMWRNHRVHVHVNV